MADVSFSSVQFSHSVVFCSLHPVDCIMPVLPVHHPLPEFTQTHVHWFGDLIQPSHPLSSHSPPAFSLSQHQVFFSNGSVLQIRCLKYWSFSFSISPSNEYSGLISFRMDYLDLLTVQGSSPSPQFKSITSSVLSFLYSPTLTSIYDYWKTIALTRRTFVGQVISLLFKKI